MKILFIDDEIENVKNLSQKINSFNLGEINFSLYFINEESGLILGDERPNLIGLGFKKDEIMGFELSDYNKLKVQLNETASKYDVIIFDRQLQTEEKNKTGVDLFVECREKNKDKFFFYVIVSKEARKEGIFYDDLKRIGISKQNYINNTEDSSASLNKELKDRLTYFRDNLFLKDICENNRKIISTINDQPGRRKDELQPIITYLDFAFKLLSAEKIGIKKTEVFSMAIHWYHLAVDRLCGTNKKIAEKFNDHLPDAKKIIEAGFFNADKEEKDKKTIDHYKPHTKGYPKAITKIIAHNNLKLLPFGYLLNWYRGKVIHKEGANFLPDYCYVLFAHLATALYILKNKRDISFHRIENYLHYAIKQTNKNNGANDLNAIINFLKQ